MILTYILIILLTVNASVLSSHEPGYGATVVEKNADEGDEGPYPGLEPQISPDLMTASGKVISNIELRCGLSVGKCHEGLCCSPSGKFFPTNGQLL